MEPPRHRARPATADARLDELLARVRDHLGAAVAGVPPTGVDPEQAVELAGHAVEAYLAALRGAAAEVEDHLGPIPTTTPPAGGIVVRTLGAFEAVGPSGLVRWPSRKARTLFQLLVVHHDAPLLRDVPGEALWPAVDRQRQRDRLAVVLSDLRRALDPVRAHPIDHHVRSVQGSLALDLDHVTVDLAGYLPTAAAGLAAWRTGDDDHAREVLGRAASTYRGPLLPDAAYEDWTRSRREEARRTQGDVLRALVDLHRRAGDLPSARLAAEALADLDPYDEVAHRVLVEVLATAGRHGEAEAARRSFRAALAELGVAEPAGTATRA